MSNQRADLPPERDELEEKSEYSKKHHERGVLVKTIVAMANTRGGRIVLRSLEGMKPDEFDSSRLDDLVRKYAAPAVDGLCAWSDGGSVFIDVPEGVRKPHVFICDLWFVDDRGIRKPAFSPGQVWVRHSAKNEPARAEDFSRFMREEVSRFLQRMSVQVASAELSLRPGAQDGVPVRLSDDPGATAIVADIEMLYPYTTRELGALFGHGQNWGSAAARALDLQGKVKYWWGLRGKRGSYSMQRYSEAAVDAIRERLAETPRWRPYGDLRD